MSEFIPSTEQEAIRDWFATGMANGRKSKHLVVEAGAGTGKTTTILWAISAAPESDILLCAFNKDIATELQKRLDNPNATARTIHSLGYAAVAQNWKGWKVDGSRAGLLALAVCGSQTPEPVIRLVANLHTKGREIAPHAKNLGDLTDLAIRFECEPDATWADQGFDLEFVETKALAAMELAAKGPSNGVIDYSDMLYLPLRNNWLRPRFNLVVGDEAQDWTTAQLEIMQRVCKGRIAVVGDSNQAIYGFRGADADSLMRLKNELGAEVLGLRVTRRCGRAIVAVAQTIVPDYYAHESVADGVVRNLDIAKLTAEVANGDFVLSRVNAPLVSVAMKMLREGKRARIKGRDIGAALNSLVRKLAVGQARNSVPALIDRIGAWKDKEMARLLPQLQRESSRSAAESKMAAIEDQAETLINIAEGATSVSEVSNRIEHLFTDDGLGTNGVITCSSVHRSKGLEANRVFILAKTLRSGSREEDNIRYVAITRAKSELVMVTESAV